MVQNYKKFCVVIVGPHPLIKGWGGGRTFQKLSHLGARGGGTKNFARKGG